MKRYHGTPNPEAVLREGLVAAKAPCCPHIWLAVTPQDAAVFGTVIEVTVGGLLGTWPLTDEGEEEWQAAYHGGNMGPARLKLWKDGERARQLKSVEEGDPR